MRARRGPSRKETDRRPSKKLKCEKRVLAKADDKCGFASCRLCSGEPAERSATEGSPHSFTMMLQSEGKQDPKMADEMPADRAALYVQPLVPDADGSFPKSDSEALFQPCIQNVEEEEEEEGEEEDNRSGLSEDSEMEPEGVEHLPLELDNSAFLNEDSNQPLPVDRFFGSVAFMQDPPPVPLTRPIPSRREFRKAHFIAKDDDDDDEEEEEVI